MSLDLMVREILAAMIGTVAFSVLFDVPKSEYPFCGLVGGIGWLVYLLTTAAGGSAAVAALLATMAVVALSRAMSVKRRCPVTIFLIAGIFPLVPGAGIFWMVHNLVDNQLLEAVSSGYEALKCAIAIVLGIVIIFEIPQEVFTFQGRGQQK